MKHSHCSHNVQRNESNKPKRNDISFSVHVHYESNDSGVSRNELLLEALTGCLQVSFVIMVSQYCTCIDVFTAVTEFKNKILKYSYNILNIKTVMNEL